VDEAQADINPDAQKMLTKILRVLCLRKGIMPIKAKSLKSR